MVNALVNEILFCHPSLLPPSPLTQLLTYLYLPFHFGEMQGS